MRMKLFTSFTFTKSDIEKSINAWLDQNPNAKIVDIKQSCYYSFWAASPLFITVWYEPSRNVTQENQQDAEPAGAGDV